MRSVVTPRATNSPANSSTSAAICPARRMASISASLRTADDTAGPGSPVLAYGGRSIWPGTRRRGPTSPGLTGGSEAGIRSNTATRDRLRFAIAR